MMMKGMKGKCMTTKISWILVVIGALNWGLIGIGGFFGANWNVINLIFGAFPALEWIIYLLVGLAGLVMLFGCRCKKCMGKDGMMGKMGKENMQGME